MNFRRSGSTRGAAAFTLIELLVVIAVVAVLASFLLPILGRTKEQANVVKTMSNMKQMGIAMLSYANDHNYVLPNRVTDGDDQPKWPSLLYQYLGGYEAYQSPVPDASGKTYRVTDPTNFKNNQINYTSYIYNGMNDAGAHGDPTVAIRLNAMNNASQTILLGIPYPQTGQFYMDFDDGDNFTVLNKKAFDAGSVYMFCDGSARMLVYNNDSTTYKKQPPPGPGTYTDWLWLLDKSMASAIQ